MNSDDRGLTKYAFIDIDGTIYNGYTIKDLAISQAEKGLLSHDSINELFTLYELFKSGHVPYETVANSALEAWGMGLEGQSVKTIEEHTRNIFTQKNSLFPFAQELVKVLNEKGFHTMIVTGEPQFIGSFFADYVGTRSYISSEYEVVDSNFTGKTLVSLGTSNGKREALQKLGNQFSGSTAFGDSEGDISMFELVDFPFCVNPSAGLLEKAKSNKWNVVTEVNIIEEVQKIL